MRTVLVTAIAVLLCVIAARLVQPTSDQAATRATLVQAISRGAVLPASGDLGARDQVDAAIIVGDRTLGVGSIGRGLLVARLEHDGTPSTRRAFGQSARAEHVRAFLDAIEPGEFAVLAHLGSLDFLGTEFQALVTELGSSATFGDGSTSFALATLKTDAGWQLVTESTSAESGVVLATYLPPEPGWTPRRERERRPAQGLVTLTREEARLAPGVFVEASREFRGGAFECWTATVDSDQWTTLVAFDAIPLGPNPQLTLGLALARGSTDLEVRTTVATRTNSESFPYSLYSTRSALWIPLQVDLSAYADESVALLFEAKRRTPSGSGTLHLGRPTLSDAE